MKKFTLLFLALALCFAMTACGAKKDAEPAPAASSSAAASSASAEAETGTGVYTIYNQTGETVTELYLYETGAEDKGENHAADGMEADASLELTFEAAADAELTLAFVTEGGYEAAFETLHIEEAPISLLSADALTGATPIAFQAAE